MPNYFAIGFVGILACVGVGLEYHRQSVQAGLPMSEFAPSQFVAGVKESVRTSIKERSDQVAAVRRASLWQGEMRQHLPEAPEGWTRRGFDEGDNTAIVPAGKKVATTYGEKHPLNDFMNETFSNLKNLKHVHKKELSGQSDEDFLFDITSAASYVYEKGEETVFIELLLKEEQETETLGGNALARGMAFAESLNRHEAEPEPFAVIAGIPFFEAFDREGLMLGHYRVLYAKLGLHEEVRFIVHANASTGSTRDILKAVDFEALNGLLRIPMTHVSNAFELPDAKTEKKYAFISNFVRKTGQINLRSHMMLQSTAYRTRQKPPEMVEKYGADTPLRDMYVMQYRDAMQRLVEFEDLGNRNIDMNELIYEVEPPEDEIQNARAQESSTEQPAAPAEAAPVAPVGPKPEMSLPLRRELESLQRSTKVKVGPKAKAAIGKPQKTKVTKPGKRLQKAAEKKVKVNRLRTTKKGGCGGGSFCKVNN